MSLQIKWSKYIPEDKKPHAKQLAFLSLPHQEAFYGGAAGGGKSEALLMGALAWCDTPGFSGIIFRRTFTDMQLPSSILSRCKEWLAPWLEAKLVKYDKQQHTFYFPEGAKLAFGYLKAAGSEERYASSEYHYVAFDELTHFMEEEYTFLFSRMRATKDTAHIPLKMRSASNPSPPGLMWVKNRFGITKNQETGEFFGTKDDRPFIPAKMQDNPYIDPQYEKSLEKLGKVRRERLKNGDWDAIDEALFDNYWFTDRYTQKSNGINIWYHLLEYEGLRVYRDDDLFYFTTVDCAASTKTGVSGVSFFDDRQASWSVISTWGVTPKYDLLLLDVDRFQTNIPELIDRIGKNQMKWKPLYNIIEKNGPGEGVYQISLQKGYPVKPIHSSNDKIINSTAAQLRAEQGKIWLPGFAPWLKTFEDELFSWTGSKIELDDQVDTLSNACNEVMELSVGYERDTRFRSGLKRAIPTCSGGIFPKRVIGGKEIKNISRSISVGGKSSGLSHLRGLH